MYAAALLEGTAADGVNGGLEKITSNLNNPVAWPWKTGEEFLAHLAKKFATLDLAADGENKIRKLAQKDEYAAFTDFITEFTNLTDVCDWDDTARVRALKEKISKDLKKLVACQVTQPDRDDFSGWVEMVHKLSINQESMEQSYKGGNNNHHNNSGNYIGKAKDGKGDPMDLDNMRLNAAKIHPQERDRRYNDGLCFNCGQAGHLSRDCQNPTNTRGGGAGRGRGGGGRGRGGNGGQYNGHAGGFGGNGFGGNGFGGNGFGGNGFGGGFGGYGNGVGGGQGGYQGGYQGGWRQQQQPGQPRRGGYQQQGRGGYQQQGRGGGPQLRFIDAPEYIPDDTSRVYEEGYYNPREFQTFPAIEQAGGDNGPDQGNA